MSIEGEGHFFTIYFPGFVCFVLYLAKISGERLQDHWSSGSILFILAGNDDMHESTEEFEFLSDRQLTARLAALERVKKSP